MWWPFSFDKTYKESGLFQGMTDWHAHILPDVDDGVQGMDNAINVLRQYERMGVKDVWLTPHISTKYPNNPATLRAIFDELNEKHIAQKRSETVTPVILHLGAEHMLDGEFLMRLKSGNVIPIGEDGDMLLVETPNAKAPDNLDEMMQAIVDAGYCPVLAHPERYLYMHGDEFRRLHKKYGCRYQLNIISVAGLQGPDPKRRSKLLLESGTYYLIGSNLHNLHKFFAAITEYKIGGKHLKMMKKLAMWEHE